jgi:DNA helicase HerA-like ATPase
MSETRHPVPDAALDADIAILGKKGRGKTFTAKGIVERLLHMGRRVGRRQVARLSNPGFWRATC